MSNRPDITTATRLAHTQRGEYAVDPMQPATPGSPASFQDMHYKIRHSRWEAVAVGELVQSLKSWPSGTAIGVMMELPHTTHAAFQHASSMRFAPMPPETGAAMAGAHEPANHAGGAGEESLAVPP